MRQVQISIDVAVVTNIEEPKGTCSLELLLMDCEVLRQGELLLDGLFLECEDLLQCELLLRTILQDDNIGGGYSGSGALQQRVGPKACTKLGRERCRSTTLDVVEVDMTANPIALAEIVAEPPRSRLTTCTDIEAGIRHCKSDARRLASCWYDAAHMGCKYTAHKTNRDHAVTSPDNRRYMCWNQTYIDEWYRLLSDGLSDVVHHRTHGDSTQYEIAVVQCNM